MIVLDTNVVSELMKHNGNPAVQSWLDSQSAEYGQRWQQLWLLKFHKS